MLHAERYGLGSVMPIVLAALDAIGTLVRRQPRRKRRWRFVCGAQLPQNHPDVGAREAIVGNCDRGGVRARRYRRHQALLESNRLGIAEQP
jgi:hypothetical protein